jgi:hypothetical protein
MLSDANYLIYFICSGGSPYSKFLVGDSNTKEGAESSTSIGQEMLGRGKRVIKKPTHLEDYVPR